uniref:Uncharacterized protein n=1 Tax=Rhizophora mucronata TaxID=61149 RepID=A0A2P2NPZ3_RHIMU
MVKQEVRYTCTGHNHHWVVRRFTRRIFIALCCQL